MSRPLIRRLRPYIQHRHPDVANKWKYFAPWYPTTPVDKLMPALPPDVRVPLKPRSLNSMFSKGSDARLELLGERLTKLIKFERIELVSHQAQETRMYAERVSQSGRRDAGSLACQSHVLCPDQTVLRS